MAADAHPSDRRKLASFCLDDYIALLRALINLGYRDVGLDRLGEGGRAMFLRHDVDLCLRRAVSVGEAEALEGASATYYVLVSTDIYNIASAANRNALRRLIECGHRVGLHFDATRYDGGREALEQAAEAECAILQQLTGEPVESISFHRPAPELIGMSGRFSGRHHPYEPCFFHDTAYISDSSGGFFRGHPLDHPAVIEGKAIQLLTHPIWWASEEPTPAASALAALRAEKLEQIDRAITLATAKAPKGSAGT